MPRQIDKIGDLWKDVLGPGIDLGEWLRQIEKLLLREVAIPNGDPRN